MLFRMKTRLVLLLAVLLAFSTDAFAQKKGAKGANAGGGQAAANARKPLTIWDYQSELGLSDQQVKDIKDTLTTLLKYQQDCRNRMAKNDRDAQELLNADTKAKLEPAVKGAQDKINKNNQELKGLLEADGDINRMKALWKSNFDTMVDLKVEQIKAQRSTDPNAALDKVKEYMTANVNILVEMQGADVTAARQINKLLSADQMKKWKDIKKRVASAATGPASAPETPTKVGDEQ
jgi:hypothetical protein